MKKLSVILLLATLAFLLAHCTIHTNPVAEEKQLEISPGLLHIDSLMWHDPDSALKSLLPFRAQRETNVISGETKYSREISSDFNKNYYHLLISEALFKTSHLQYKRLELQNAMHYFDSLVPQCHDNVVIFLSARAHYMNGVGLFENDSILEACNEYLNALKIMETNFPTPPRQRFMMLIHCRLGNLFSNQFMQEPAIICYKNALKFNDPKDAMLYDKASLLQRLGLQYHKLQQYDSARYFYNEALLSLPDTNNPIYENLIFFNAMLDYESDDDIEQGIGKLKSLALQWPEPDRFGRFVTIGELYMEAGRNDSAVVYLQSAFENGFYADLKCSAAEFLSKIYQNEGDTLKATQYALYFAEHSDDKRVSMARVSMLNDVFQKHQQWEQRRAKDKEQKNNINKMLLFVIAAVLIIIAVFIAFRFRRRKEAPTMAFTERWAQFEKTGIFILIRERLSSKGYKLAVKNIGNQTDLSLNNADFVALRTAVDDIFEGITKTLSKQYPELNTTDLNTCCLGLMGLSNTEIAALLGVKYNSLSNRLSKIKKIFNTEENLLDFLMKIWQNTQNV